MLVFYVVSLSVAAALTGSFAERVLAALGFIPGFGAGLYVTLGVAGLYAAVQLAFLFAMRAYQPTRTGAALTTEGFSHLASIFLLPYLVNVPIPWPSALLERAEPILFAALFAGVHAFLKLATFYASLRGAYDPSRPIWRWGGASLAAAFLGVLGLAGWFTEVERARETVTGPPQWVAAGAQYAKARVAAEGATLSGRLEVGDAPQLAVRFSNAGGAAGRPETAVERAYVTVTLHGTETKLYQSSTRLYPDRWAEILVPEEFFPARADRYEVRWTREAEPNWQRILGLRPIVYTAPGPGEEAGAPASVYLSGAYTYFQPQAANRPRYNVLLVAIDGLAANHLSLLGYEREVTPAIDRVGYRGVIFPNTYVPSKDTGSALRALLTGQDVAALGASGTAGGALPALLRDAGYAVVAFVENGGDSPFHQRAWAEGFELVDETYTDPGSTEGTSGSAATVGRVRAWVSEHRQTPFFCLVRLGELAALPSGDVHERVFEAGDGSLRDVDRFDNALLAIDRQLGALFKYIRDHETRSNTCVIVTAPFGQEFSLGSSRKHLGLRSERVPLVIHVPGRGQGKRPDRVEMHDVGATVAGLTGVRFAQPVEGTSVLR